MRKQPDAVWLKDKLAAIWILEGRFDKAESMCRRILSGNPDDGDALNNLAWLLAMRDGDKADEALGLITKAVYLYGPTLMEDTFAVV